MNAWLFVWIAITLAALVVEMATAALVSIWLVPGALVAGIMAFGGVSWVWQMCMFVLVSALSLAVSLVFIKKRPKKKAPDESLNQERIIGRVTKITEIVDNVDGSGECVIDGQRWSCRSDDDTSIWVGSTVVVTAIRGSRLIVREVGPQPGSAPADRKINQDVSEKENDTV